MKKIIHVTLTTLLNLIIDEKDVREVFDLNENDKITKSMWEYYIESVLLDYTTTDSSGSINVKPSDIEWEEI